MKTMTVSTSRQAEITRLRESHYNAALTDIREVHDDLRVFRVRPDGGVPAYLAGQFTTLGLGYWEPRAPNTQPEHLSPDAEHKMVKRAYSISFPILDESGRLLDRAHCDFLEFYVALVRESSGPPPALTPRLFHLAQGDRLFVGTKITGHYTLASVLPTDDVVFLATGTGEAPHNVMIPELLDGGHAGRIISAVCVRRRGDLAYESAHRALEKQFPNYRYLPVTTREPENLDRNRPDYIGKQHVQMLLETGRLERELGHALDPHRTHVFLCGNPGMIGIPHADEEGHRTYPEPPGIIELLERRGFHADLHGRTGNVHFEKYW
jgi:ferredoxin--NADP+ reductase